MRLMRRFLSPAGFILSALAFLLPFLGIQLGSPMHGAVDVVWSGVDLVVGGDVSASVTFVELHEDDTVNFKKTTIEQFYGQDQAEQLVPHRFLAGRAMAVVAALLILAGVLAPILAGDRIPVVVGAVAGFGAAVSLTIAAFRAEAYLGPLAGPLYGFWHTLGLLIVLGAGNTVALALALIRKRSSAPDKPELTGPSLPDPS